MASDSELPRLSRRRLLKLGVGSAVAIGVGGVLAWHSSGYDAPRSIRDRLRTLSVKQYLVVEAVAARILRSGGSELPDPSSLELGVFIDGFLQRVHRDDVTDLGRLLHLLEHALPLTSGYVSRFTRLDGASQDEVLSSMQSSGVAALRGAHDSLRSLCAMAYFRRPETWAAIGYDGPMVGRPAEGWSSLPEGER